MSENPTDEQRARALAIAILSDCAMRYIEGPQSQVDRAINLGERTALAAFASIRAEGSAERAKLEAALREARADVVDWLDNEHLLEGATQLIDLIDGVLPQPAESGATDRAEIDACVAEAMGAHDVDTCPTCGGLGGTSDCVCHHPKSGAKP